LGPKNAFWPPEAHFFVKNQLLGPESAFCGPSTSILILGSRTCISATVSRGGFCEKNKNHMKNTFSPKKYCAAARKVFPNARDDPEISFSAPFAQPL
jgi:hypothetical protein